MEIDVATLPDDPQLLREILSQALAALSKTEAEKVAIVARLEAEKLAIEEKYLALFNRLFRPRSEKLNEDQLSLIFESLADMGIPDDQLEKLEPKVAPEKTRRKRAAGARCRTGARRVVRLPLSGGCPPAATSVARFVQRRARSARSRQGANGANLIGSVSGRP